MLTQYRRKIDALLTERLYCKKQIQQEQEALHLSQERVLDATQAQNVIQVVAQNVQKMAHEQIAGVVSRCLETVFDEPYEFTINFERKRGKTDACLVFKRDGFETEDALGTIGGGVVDVGSFAARIARMMLERPAKRKLLVLDEPFKHLSMSHTDRVATLLEQLSSEMGIQFILVTHNSQLEVGKVVRL